MRRREFISLLGGAAAVWPLASQAQQRERVRRIGVLMHLAVDDPDGQSRLAAFLQGLQEAGWAVGRNVAIEVRWAAADIELNEPICQGTCRPSTRPHLCDLHARYSLKIQ